MSHGKAGGTGTDTRSARHDDAAAKPGSGDEMTGTLDFRILGPVQVIADGQPVPIAGPRQRTVLAMLLLEPQRVISLDRLVEAVWGNTPPATSRTQIAICIASLRKVFHQATGADDVLVTAAPGYMLMPGEHRIDAVDFGRGVQEAATLAEEGRICEAARRLGDALGLWAGPVLSDISSHVLSTEAAWLEEQRLTAAEQHAALTLDLGRHHEIVPRLSVLVQNQPLREEARATLMLALYRCGRRSEALALFRQARQVFVEELGLEPGRALQSLHDAILRDDPALLPAAPIAPPRLAADESARLPSDVGVFVGRERELAALDSLLEADQGHDGIGLIVGQPGVGKTALAVHWARRVAAHFPGGQLFADLREEADEAAGTDPTCALLGHLLRALGLPEGQIPVAQPDRGALLRRAVTGRRMLIVVDDVPVGTCLDDIAPGDGNCCVLATSRAQQSVQCVPARARLKLDPLRQAEAVTLLGALVGDRRTREDGQAIEQVARLCEGLPLAVAAAAARLGVKQHWSVRDLLARLRDPHRRLEELSRAQPAVRSVFDAAYGELEPADALTYRQLGGTEPAELDADTGAVLLETSPVRAENLMEQLTDAGLLEVAGRGTHGRFRYQISGLLALHATERARLEAGRARDWVR
jgi:DNA-binding SARP family transcriptional activator